MNDEAEPVVDFDDLPDQYEESADEAYEWQDWQMENYPQFN